MNCPNCKNPILENSTECEWCGSVIKASIKKQLSEDNINSNVKFKRTTILLSPGIAVILIWCIGNLMSERDKHAIFNMDDLSPILVLGLILLGIGLLIKYVKK